MMSRPERYPNDRARTVAAPADPNAVSSLGRALLGDEAVSDFTISPSRD
jgi:hypothetical protein